MKKKYITALSIAGFDGSGGAGIQADLKTFSALKCYGMTVLTSLPAQNTVGVRSIYDISANCVNDQLIAILDDIKVDAIKIGMLYKPEIVEIVAKILSNLNNPLIVTDPVMIAKSGDPLITSETISALKEKIIPISTIITPNLPEASALLNKEISNIDEIKDAAINLLKLGSKAVVVKGGHLEGSDSTDCLYYNNEFYWFKSNKINTINNHGTGCTFSAAITSYLARGNNIVESVSQAKEYITTALKFGSEYEIGHGHGPVHHFANVW